jgi:hypothetical protein
MSAPKKNAFSMTDTRASGSAAQSVEDDAPTTSSTIKRTIKLNFPKSIGTDKKNELLHMLSEKLRNIGEITKNEKNEDNIKTTGLKNFYTAINILKMFVAENITHSITFSFNWNENPRGGGDNDSDSDYYE